MSAARSLKCAQLEAQDRLEDATLRSSALLETMAALLTLTESSHHPILSDSAVRGLQLIALQEGANLRDRFTGFLSARRLESKTLDVQL